MREKSMWARIRKSKGLTQTDVADKFGITKQAISAFENGYRGMPLKIKIYYLELRNSDEDKVIIKYLLEDYKRRKNGK